MRSIPKGKKKATVREKNTCTNGIGQNYKNKNFSKGIIFHKT
jgi:hypothetical protein